MSSNLFYLHVSVNCKEVSELKVCKIINNTPNRQCEFDSCPTSFIKACLNILITPITSIINNSLKEGTFPQVFKNAIVTPLIKKTALHKNELKNFRPVSGLNFISKLIEKVVANQVEEHMSTFNLDNPY